MQQWCRRKIAEAMVDEGDGGGSGRKGRRWWKKKIMMEKVRLVSTVGRSKYVTENQGDFAKLISIHRNGDERTPPIMKGEAAVLNPPSLMAFEHKRDAYGFAVRPQHVQRYREYANIYKEEEEERSDRWKDFLERQAESAQLPLNGLSAEENLAGLHAEATEREADASSEKGVGEDDLSVKNCGSDDSTKDALEKEAVPLVLETKIHRAQIWTHIRPSLSAIEAMMSARVKKKMTIAKIEQDAGKGRPLPSFEDARPAKGGSEEDSEEEFYDVERSDLNQDVLSGESMNAPATAAASDVAPPETSFPWKEELECLVQGGVPMALRGELWQAFVGVRARRVDKYYQHLLAQNANTGDTAEDQSSVSDNKSKGSTTESISLPEKWKGQIEKDLPRTFPGHPALDENGRNALRRLLTAYARHNPSVGYCQAMNFFAGLLLLLMPEENAFWALMGILDDYFEGYYSEEMTESQLRVGPALVTTKDAGDAVTLLQALAGSTFDSSQLVLTACMGYQNVNEARLQELRNKHRPTVKAAVEERLKGLRVLRDSHGLASKLYGFKQESGSLMSGTNKTDQMPEKQTIGDMAPADDFCMGLSGDVEIDSVPDLQEQVVWLKVELCKLLEEKRSAVLRAEELETALMEMVKQDNRRQLSAKVEQLERDVAELRQALADKQEQENAMLQVLMRVEQEQRVTEDARRFAEQDAAAQRYAAQVLQEKYEAAAASIAEMEKRVVMAESMLEATLQYQSGQTKAQPSPRYINTPRFVTSKEQSRVLARATDKKD
ncbi:hypothetical protein RJ640_013286 [Escallonia rubra]|uniref:Rab-GAP TBC domain-containing protein n=1 Tax=Escallonia rubra TaxID=112253 RepID=A0AA88UL54_9ASTE|nr:hypothetical protein RJ640_013286 [Escallonia rubra]